MQNILYLAAVLFLGLIQRPSDLKLTKEIKLTISEPSGITCNPSGTNYWIVSGGDQRIYKTELNGKILQVLKYAGNDIEGICFDKRDSSLWIAEERLRDIVHLDLNGNELGRFHANIPGKKNKGLEGVTIDKDGNLWVINEKKPAALYRMDTSGKIINSFPLNYTSDLSDIAYDFKSGNFFILSDESSCFFIWNENKGRLKTITLPRNKFEGITVNIKTKSIAIVNDDDSTMLVFDY